MTPFQEVVRLKIEQKKADIHRCNEICKRTYELASQLSHEEAVFIVKKYEKDVST